MRVARPSWLNKKTILLVMVLFVAITSILLYWSHQKHARDNETVAQSNARIFSQYKDPNDMRVVAASYEQSQDYEKAENTWKQITQQTKDTNDYWSLLNICANYKVSDKDSCVRNSASTLQEKVKNLDFTTAYSIGATLESNGYKKLSVPFYAQALATYKPQSGGANFPTQQQLQAKINELSK